MSEKNACPECGGTVPPDAPRGLCPRCLMGAACSPTGTTLPDEPLAARPGEKPIIDRGELLATLRDLDLVPAAVLDRLDAEDSDDPVEMARALVRAGKLTTYQAGAVLQGKARGLIIGQYLVLDRLGVGGMGVVFKARHRPSGRVVALKILPPSFGREGEAVRRFRREFQVASRLSHPNLVAAVEASEDRGVHYLTMEYIPGYDLDRLVGNGGPMELKLALHCVIQAARGLEAAHAQGVIHRDIKPGNIMIDPAGAVRVLDLGLARVIAATSAFGQTAAGTLTQTGSYMGTVDFLAPEQANDAKTADGRADIYSLGCTLYYLLAGKPPFPGKSVLHRLMAHQDRPAPSLRAARPEVPEALEEVYLRMMAKRPEDRPQSVSEVLMDLEACRTSAREAGDVSADLKTFARTAMKRAPVRGRRGPDDSVYARPKPKPDLLTFDPELDLEDLVSDYRDEIGHAPIPEDKLPPIASRPLLIKPRRRKSSAPYAWIGLFLLVLVVAALAFRPASEPPRAIPAPTLPTPRPEVAVEEPPPDRGDTASPPPVAKTGFQLLFNGKDLSGWTADSGERDSWRVEGGDLVVTGPGNWRKSGFLLSDREVSDFLLRFEFLASPGANSGVCFRAVPGEFAGRLAQPLQVELFDADKPGNPVIKNGSLIWTNGTRVQDMLPPGRAFELRPSGSWNTVEMLVRGDTLRVLVNGVEALDTDLAKLADKPDANPALRRRSGRIGFQSHTGTTRFRNIEIRDLPSEIVSTPAPARAPAPEADSKFLLTEDFNTESSRWPVSTAEQLAKGVDNPHGFGEGFWYCMSHGSAQFAWNVPGGHYPEMEVEVAVKVVGAEAADPRGGGLIQFHADVPGGKGDRAERGFQVRINGAGKLMLEPSFWTSKPYPNGPWRAISHPAIRPGGEPNVLKFRLQKRKLVILANGIPVTAPIPFNWDLTPSSMCLGVDSWSGIVRAEYDRIVIRELAPEPQTDRRTPAIRPEARRPADAREFMGKFYQVFPQQLSWREAKARCQGLGGRLAVVSNEEENRFLNSLVKEQGLAEAWLGATDEQSQGRWVWVDGTTMRYSNWDVAGKQPNNKQGLEHYLLLRVEVDGKWSDQPNISTQHHPGFVCQWD